MGLEALKQQLAEGKLTQEQFAAEAKKLLDAGTITNEEYEAAIKVDGGAGGQGGNGGEFTETQLAAIQKMMQSEADKVRTKAAQEKKALEDQLEKMKTEKMTEEEKTKHELEKLQRENKETADQLLKEKVAFHTVKTLSAKELPSEFDVFLVGPTIEDTDTRIAAFQTAWGAAIKAAVDARFKDGGGDPPGGKGGGSTKKWAEMTLTEQGQLFGSNPGLAKSLAAQAGVNLDI